MGIGNTTTSACVLSALTGTPAETVVGRGGGLNDAGLAKKIHIVEEAVSKLKNASVFEILAAVGGFDICAMTGAFVGAAYYRLPACNRRIYFCSCRTGSVSDCTEDRKLYVRLTSKHRAGLSHRNERT